MTARLRSVPVSPEPPLDIGALIRADALSRDWAACHVAGDRNPPLAITDRVRRTWRA